MISFLDCLYTRYVKFARVQLRSLFCMCLDSYQLQGYETGWARDTCWRHDKCMQNLVWKPERRKHVKDLGVGRNITKTKLKEWVWEGMDWINMV